MWFWKRHKRQEAEVQAIRKELWDKADEAKENTERLNKLLKEKDLGVSGYLFYATGGDGRLKKGRR